MCGRVFYIFHEEKRNGPPYGAARNEEYHQWFEKKCLAFEQWHDIISPSGASIGASAVPSVCESPHGQPDADIIDVL